MSIDLLERLRAGHVVTGMQCFSASPILVESMGRAGMDFVTVDMEHCPTGLETMAHLFRAAAVGGITAYARIPRLDSSIIGRVLDLGAAGFVLPHASTERCREALRHARYSPQGDRSACPMIRAAGYMPDDWNAFAEAANRTVRVIPLIEDEQGLAQCEEIFALDGIDMVFVGPFDLSMSLGLPGQDFRHPTMRGALDRITTAAIEQGKFVMTTVAGSIDHDYAAALLRAGVSMLSFSADVGVFMAACRRIVEVGHDAQAPVNRGNS